MAPKFDPITEPGVYDISEEQYHADPAFSSSHARLLIDTCPAKLRHAIDNPQPPNRNFDFGHVAHKLVLGRGDHVKVISADDFRTKAAKNTRDQAYAAGKIPILLKDFEKAQDMEAAIRSHPFAGDLFKNGSGEQSLFWQDPEFGMMCRARLDWLPQGDIFADYKTCASADPDFLKRQLANHTYHKQDAWYLDGIEALGLSANPRFIIVFQEKDPPHLITVIEIPGEDVARATVENRKARSIFKRCTDENHWPGYTDDKVLPLGLPYWARLRHDEDASMGVFEISKLLHEPLPGQAAE